MMCNGRWRCQTVASRQPTQDEDDQGQDDLRTGRKVREKGPAGHAEALMALESRGPGMPW